MKRLFIAVDIDEPTRRQVEQIQTRLQANLDVPVRISWVASERLHVTMAFFGTADVEQEARLVAALGSPFDLRTFDIAFSAIGAFPRRGAPRVLWLGVSLGVPALERLKSAVDTRIGPHRGAGDPFTPHLTLARVRDRAPALRFEAFGRFAATAGPTRIDRVTLYESRRSPAGVIYVRRADGLLQP